MFHNKNPALTMMEREREHDEEPLTAQEIKAIESAGLSLTNEQIQSLEKGVQRGKFGAAELTFSHFNRSIPTSLTNYHYRY